MNRSIPLALALVLVVSLTALPLAGATTQEQTPEQAAAGEQLDAALGVQQAEIDAEVQDRTFGLEIAQAQSADEAADVLAERVTELENRLNELDDERADLEEKRAAGELSDGQAAADAAPLASEAAALERQAQTAAAVAEQLPEDVLSEHDIDVDAIQKLATQASDLSTEEIVSLAQSIAGESVGTPLDGDWEPGVPDDVEIPDGADQNDNAP